MANNIGVTTETLPRTIGQTINFDATEKWNTITMITGQLDLGAIIFDNNGTMGVCSEFNRDDNDNPIYTIKTMTLDTQIDITTILSKDY
ncbi:MAG: hypothetical protein K2P14_03760 [Anaeroplasmataceae bacterium]|nr:hypothetical protein [Anaeroplasmataceae bacterium]